MKNKILVVVDMQKDFINGSLGTPEAQGIVRNVIDKIRSYHAAEQQVIFTRDTHQRNYLETQEGKHLPVEHCIKGTAGWEIFSHIDKEIDIRDDIILNKPTFGSEELVNQIAFIAEAVGDIDQIEFVGLCTGICVIANVILVKTFFTEVPIVVDANCCACVTPESHKTALEAMKLLQVEVIGGQL